MKLTSYLKALLSLFVSKNEKDFITQQAFPIAEYSRFDDVASGSYQYNVSPIDGWVKVQITTSSTSMSRYRVCSYSASGDIELVAYTSYRDSSGASDVTIPIRKGQKFGFIANREFNVTIKYCVS